MKKLRRVIASSSKQIFRVWYNPYNYPDEEDYIDVTAVDEDEARRKARSMGYVTEVEIKEDITASKVVAAMYSDPFNAKLDGSAEVKHGPTMRYMCHYGSIESPEFVAQLSKIAPYDDADYVWARIYENKKVDFIKDGHAIDSMQLPRYDEDDYESVGEYVDDCIDQVVIKLNEFNERIKPIMVHN